MNFTRKYLTQKVLKYYLEEKMQCRAEVVIVHGKVCHFLPEYLALHLVNGHTMLNTPVLVRSLKLSNIGPG
jgi:hypothetical protein